MIYVFFQLLSFQSLTRTAMNLGQLLGPLVGGALYQYGGFYLPFLSMGALQACMGIVSIVSMKEIPGKCFLMQICLTIKIEDLTLN